MTGAPFSRLPRDVLPLILGFCPSAALDALARTSKPLRAVARCEDRWCAYFDELAMRDVLAALPPLGSLDEEGAPHVVPTMEPRSADDALREAAERQHALEHPQTDDDDAEPSRFITVQSPCIGGQRAPFSSVLQCPRLMAQRAHFMVAAWRVLLDHCVPGCRSLAAHTAHTPQNRRRRADTAVALVRCGADRWLTVFRALLGELPVEPDCPGQVADRRQQWDVLRHIPANAAVCSDLLHSFAAEASLRDGEVSDSAAAHEVSRALGGSIASGDIYRKVAKRLRHPARYTPSQTVALRRLHSYLTGLVIVLPRLVDFADRAEGMPRARSLFASVMAASDERWRQAAAAGPLPDAVADGVAPVVPPRRWDVDTATLSSVLLRALGEGELPKQLDDIRTLASV